MTELDQALNGEQPVEEAETKVEATETDESPKVEETPPTGESVEDLKAELEKARNETQAFKSKALDETTKRQQLQQQMAQPQQEKGDFWDNPDQALSDVTSTVASEVQKARIDMSVVLYSELKDDYAEMEAIFAEAAQSNRSLAIEMAQSANPAKFAYDYGKTQTQMSQYSDPAKMREQIKAELRAEMEAETDAKIEAEINKTQALPGSLANERGAAATSNYAPPDLEKLIG